MPALTINIPPDQAVRVMNALCSNVDLPPTQENTVDALRRIVIRIVLAYESQQAINAAQATVVDPTPITPT